MSLKTFSRVENETTHIVDLGPIMQTSIDMTQNEIRHTAHLETRLEPTPFEQNVLRASCFTNAEGEAVVEVADTGPGISEENQQKIFEPFFTTKPVGVGTGLDLSICHSLVTGFGGRIEVDSSPQGSAIRVLLPASSRELTSQSPTIVKGSNEKARILVVDDEPVIGMVISQALRNHEIVSLTSAFEAFGAIESSEFDLVLTDLMMPGMTGMDFFERLTKSNPEGSRKVVFMTGGAFTQRAREFLDSHPGRCIEKPFTPDELRLFIQRWLSLARKR